MKNRCFLYIYKWVCIISKNNFTYSLYFAIFWDMEIILKCLTIIAIAFPRRRRRAVPAFGCLVSNRTLCKTCNYSASKRRPECDAGCRTRDARQWVLTCVRRTLEFDATVSTRTIGRLIRNGRWRSFEISPNSWLYYSITFINYYWVFYTAVIHYGRVEYFESVYGPHLPRLRAIGSPGTFHNEFVGKLLKWNFVENG